MMTSSNGNIIRVHWPFVRGIHRSPVNSPHKGQWRGALMFSLICAWINGWVNNRESGDLRRHRTHCDVTIIKNPIRDFRLCLSHWARDGPTRHTFASCILYYLQNAWRSKRGQYCSNKAVHMHRVSGSVVLFDPSLMLQTLALLTDKQWFIYCRNMIPEDRPTKAYGVPIQWYRKSH